jgi:hypothetical protein
MYNMFLNKELCMKMFKLVCKVNGDCSHTIERDINGQTILTFYRDMDDDDIEVFCEGEEYREGLGDVQSDMLWSAFDSTIEIVDE